MENTLDIEFRDLSYWAHNPVNNSSLHCCSCAKRHTKSGETSRTQILRCVSGIFKSGELTAVLGPSGAGKTSLLSVLAGFRTSGVEGTILLNGRSRCNIGASASRRLTCLIPQEFAMLDVLTVQETMHVAALLKLGTRQGSQQDKIRETVSLLGLDGCLHTTVGCLSGGEKKRLSCGVELLSNPPLMFFDEPTSGLDACSAHQVLNHLRALAHRDRRNIVCSIHQPGSRLFQAFDSVYVLAAGGQCVARGSRENLVPFLANAGFQCPSFYNPADFVLEVATGERGDISNLLALAHVVPDNYNTEKEDQLQTPICTPHNGVVGVLEEAKRAAWLTDLLSSLCQPRCGKTSPHLSTHASPTCSQWQQLSVLLTRATKCSFRDLHMAKLRFAAHVFVGVMLGIIFYQIGNDAARLMSNVGCVFFLMLFLFFSNAMPSVQTFPAELAVMLREHLNGWYSVRAYYVARSIADIPLQLFCPSVFLAIAYFLTGQPSEVRPFLQIWVVSLLLTLVAQTLGLLVGAASDIKMGIFLVPVISIPMLLFSGYFVRIADIPGSLQWISHLSAFRYAFEACLVALYGYERVKLPCSLPYCHVRSPAKFLQELGLQDARYLECIAALVVYILVLRVSLYLALKWRVKQAK